MPPAIAPDSNKAGKRCDNAICPLPRQHSYKGQGQCPDNKLMDLMEFLSTNAEQDLMPRPRYRPYPPNRGFFARIKEAVGSFCSYLQRQLKR